MHCFVYLNSLYWTLVWLAPGDTQDSEIVCFYVLFQTIGQMVMTGPTDPLWKMLIDWLIGKLQTGHNGHGWTL